MSGGPKIRRGWRATNSSGQFRGIDVTASMSVFQTERVGAAPTCRTLSTSSRSVREHARHFAEVEDRGANPRGSTISKTLHVVTVAFLVVNEAVPVRIRLWEP